MIFTTKEKHSVNGYYSEERQEIHKDIVKSLIKGEVKKNPDSILLGGGSASGKSWVTRVLVKGYHSEDEDITVIDCDKIKEMLPEYKRLIEDDPINMAPILHDESSDISEKLLDICIFENRNFIYDGTMKNYEKYNNLIAKLRENDYSVSVYVADVPVDEALRRNEERFLIEKRKVPEDVLVESHKQVVRTFLQLRKLVDSYRVLDTTGDSPEVFAEKEFGKDETILNVNRFIEFCTKGMIG